MSHLYVHSETTFSLLPRLLLYRCKTQAESTTAEGHTKTWGLYSISGSTLRTCIREVFCLGLGRGIICRDRLPIVFFSPPGKWQDTIPVKPLSLPSKSLFIRHSNTRRCMYWQRRKIRHNKSEDTAHLLQVEQPCACVPLGARAEGGPHERLLPADRDGARVWRKVGLAQFRAVHRSHTVVQVAGKPSWLSYMKKWVTCKHCPCAQKHGKLHSIRLQRN
jgi:hypothetical protein